MFDGQAFVWTMQDVISLILASMILVVLAVVFIAIKAEELWNWAKARWATRDPGDGGGEK